LIAQNAEELHDPNVWRIASPVGDGPPSRAAVGVQRLAAIAGGGEIGRTTVPMQESRSIAFDSANNGRIEPQSRQCTLMFSM
jgi:hypothetical protein